jgi:hypothetical protein
MLAENYTGGEGYYFNNEDSHNSDTERVTITVILNDLRWEPARSRWEARLYLPPALGWFLAWLTF